MILGVTAHNQPNLLVHQFLPGAPPYPGTSVSILNSYIGGMKVLVGNGKCLINTAALSQNHVRMQSQVIRQIFAFGHLS